MSAETPDLAALLAEAMASVKGSLNVAIPATVVTYDPATQTITAKPTITARYQDSELGILLPSVLPPIAKVPVAFPSALGFSITWPLTPGDTVLLVFADASLDEWKSTGSPENLPADIRRCDLTDAIAIPGLRSPALPIPATGWSAAGMVLEGASIQLGSSAAVSPVALAPLVDALVAALKVWLDTHTHTGVTTGPGASGPPAVPSPAPATVASVKVRAE
ncbi:MAG TPA: Gp138 family membrane-puncturing spike protein [Ilumatobacter sp.]|nr:Gp138 family membrane-puncturing spike protein [Ilumatobacter sp.]